VSLPSFQLLRPKTLDEAVSLMAKHDGEVKIVAGGTDLLPSMKQKLFTPSYVLDLRGVGELRGIRNVPGDGIEIGALTTLSAIEHSAIIRKDYPVLYEAVKTVASPVLRNMGTLGGNVCLDTRCLWYNQSLLWRKSCGFCLKKDGNLCHVAPGGNFLLGDVFRRHSTGAAVPGSRNRDRRAAGIAAYPIVRVLCKRWHCAVAPCSQRDCHACASAGGDSGMAWQLSEIAGSRQH
jgi:hypothetical protein